MTLPFTNWRDMIDKLKTDLDAPIKVFTPDIPQPSGLPQLAKRNNNPGNLAFAGQRNATAGDSGFARFETPEEGFHALIRQVRKDQSRQLPLAVFVEKYAPRHENDTDLYIDQLSRRLGVHPGTPLNEIPTEKLAEFIAQKESGTRVQYINPIFQL